MKLDIEGIILFIIALALIVTGLALSWQLIVQLFGLLLLVVGLFLLFEMFTRR